MLQKIVAICSIVSLTLAVWSTLAEQPAWQRYLLVVIALSFIIAVIVDRKYKSGQHGKVMTLTGTQSLTYLYNSNEVEVFYSKAFKHTPNLTIRFLKRKISTPTDVGSSHMGPPHYEIIEQRPDGFRLKAITIGRFYKPIFKWRARGVLEEKTYEKQNYPVEKKDISSQNKNIEAFQRVSIKIDVLLNAKRTDEALFEEVKTTAESLIEDHFGTASKYYHDFNNISFSPRVGLPASPVGRRKIERRAQKKGLGKLKGILRACINYFENQ